MKQLFKTVILGGAILAGSFGANATIWRLNNSNGNTLTPNINASFPVGTTLQQAHDNASVLSGDTIHVEQSNTSYGSLTMVKRLTIIGPGYFLNMNPKTQVNKGYSSIVGSITMNASTCAGSTITGLTIAGTVSMGANHLLLSRNYIGGTVYVGGTSTTVVDSTIIAQNYIAVGYNTYTITEQSGTGNLTNLIIANNYLYTYNYYAIYISGRMSGIIKNNTNDGPIIASNMYVVNNIDVRSTTNTFNNCLIEYNIGLAATSYSTPSGTANTFTTGTNLTNTSLGFVTSTSTDGAWALLGTSPAKGTGKSGDDMGMFGGSLPYVLSGIPTVPNIYALTIGSVAAGATSISVTVSTKSN